jgi:antitoxin (DNA-binding transcriptional repressor) of toxin-antitoxin stability system
MSAPRTVDGPIVAESIAGSCGARLTWPSDQPGSLETSIDWHRGTTSTPAAFIAVNDFTRESGGESVLIIKQGKPVARIRPYYIDPLGDYRAAADLIRRGIVDPPASPSDVEQLLASPNPSLPEGVSASRLIAAERETGW